MEGSGQPGKLDTPPFMVGAWTYLPQPPQLLQVHLVLDVAEKVGLPGGTTTEKELEVTALLNDRLNLILRQHTEKRVGRIFP